MPRGPPSASKGPCHPLRWVRRDEGGGEKKRKREKEGIEEVDR